MLLIISFVVTGTEAAMGKAIDIRSACFSFSQPHNLMTFSSSSNWLLKLRFSYSFRLPRQTNLCIQWTPNDWSLNLSKKKNWWVNIPDFRSGLKAYLDRVSAYEFMLAMPLGMGLGAIFQCQHQDHSVWTQQLKSIEFLHNSTFSANSWQDPASIDIQWVATIECQYW